MEKQVEALNVLGINPIATKEELDLLSIKEVESLIQDEIENIVSKEGISFFYKNVIAEGAIIEQFSRKVVEHIINREIENMFSKEIESLLIHSIYQGKAELAKRALKKISKLYKCDYRVLIAAAHLEDKEIIDFLIEKNARNIRYRIGEVIQKSISIKAFKSVEYLLNHKPIISEGSRKNIIIELSKCDNIEVVKMLIPDVIEHYIIDEDLTFVSEAVKQHFHNNRIN